MTDFAIIIITYFDENQNKIINIRLQKIDCLIRASSRKYAFEQWKKSLPKKMLSQFSFNNKNFTAKRD
jgi:hypothetical protein